MNVGKYRKAIAAVLAQAIALVIVVLSDASTDQIPAYAASVSIILTPILVWAIPNDPL